MKGRQITEDLGRLLDGWKKVTKFKSPFFFFFFFPPREEVRSFGKNEAEGKVP